MRYPPVPSPYLGREPAAHEREERFLVHVPGEPFEELVARDLVEIALDIGIDHPTEAAIAQLHDAAHGLVHRAPLAVAVADVLEFRIEHGGQDQRRGGLGHAVAHARDAQDADAALGLGQGRLASVTSMGVPVSEWRSNKTWRSWANATASVILGTMW